MSGRIRDELILGLRPSAFAAVLSLALTVVWIAVSSAGAVVGAESALSDVLLLVVIVAEPLLCVLAAAVSCDRERQAWSLLSGAGVAMAAGYLGALVQTGSLISPTVAASPSLATLWVVSALLHVAGALRFFDATPAHWASVLHRVLDVVLVLLFAALSVFSLVIVLLLRQDASVLFSEMMLFAMLSVVLPTGLLLFTLALRPKLRSWHVLLVGALLASSVSSAARAHLLMKGDVAGWQRLLADFPWYVAASLLAAAALVRFFLRRRVSRNEPVLLGERAVSWGIAATGAIFVTLPGFVYVAVAYTPSGVERTILTAWIGLLGMTAVARNLGVAIENMALRRSSTADPLTGLHNHRFFHERLDVEVQRAQREGTSLSVAVFDVDDFDRINNIHGHAAGDRCLQAIAERLTGAARASDVLCRVGGDGFALIMPDVDPLEAYKVCLRAQTRVHEQEVAPSRVGLSAGIASMPTHAHTREQLVHKADGALYWAKFHGKEQVVIFDPDLVRALGPEERIEMLEEEAYLNMVQMLAVAVDARDPYTQRHSRSVADLAVEFGTAMGLAPDHVKDIKIAALLHDVGKIGVPDAVLGKPDALTEEEYAQIREHPELAARILNAIPKQKVLPWIVAHHERFDGAGYPAGLAGEEIPFEARIISLCDAYDAMTSDRPYRVARTPEDAAEEIRERSGTQFDSALIPVFIGMLHAQGAFVSSSVGGVHAQADARDRRRVLDV